MIIWIIIGIVSLIAGAYVIFSGGSEEKEPVVPNETVVPESLPTASLAVTGAWLPANVDTTYYGDWNPSITKGRRLDIYVTDPLTATFTPTFTGGTAVLSVSTSGGDSPMSVTPDPGTLTLTTGTPYTFTFSPAGAAPYISTFTLTVTSPSGQIATTTESIGLIVGE
jgi:hypothetical protein